MRCSLPAYSPHGRGLSSTQTLLNLIHYQCLHGPGSDSFRSVIGAELVRKHEIPQVENSFS